jgi:hypothetical protein
MHVFTGGPKAHEQLFRKILGDITDAMHRLEACATNGCGRGRPLYLIFMLYR